MSVGGCGARLASDNMKGGMRSSPSPPGEDDGVQRFWLYKRGQLVLVFSSAPGPFLPTKGAVSEGEREELERPCAFASGQFMSVEWEPRVRRILARADDLVEFIELLEDRRYEVDLEPPSQRARPLRWL